MSIHGHVDSNLPQDKIFSPLKPKTVEPNRAEQNPQPQQSLTGLAWATQAAAGQPAAASSALANPKLGNQKTSSSTGRSFELQAPGLEDLAVISSTVALKDQSVAAPQSKTLYHYFSRAFNLAALEESYRETFRKSKSHNLLLERFMANVKFSAVQGLLSLLGLSAAAQEKIQNEVREQALAEIDARLKNEWAYSRAMLEIIG